MELVKALSSLKIVAILTSLIFTACLREQKEAPLAQRGSSYVGCLDAVATGKDSIQVTVKIPSQATEVQIFRNNTMVGSVFPENTENSIFNDTLLPVQGEVYKYSCKAITPSEDIIGYNEPTVKTTPEDAPVFNGVETVSIENNIHAKLTWKSPSSTGPKVTKYLVYANMNRATGSMTPNVDFTKDPIATVSAPANEYTVTTGLGDKIPYVFSVIACTYNDICAGSDVYKTASTLDNGKPITNGISNIETLSGGIKVTAPWSESMGETTKRVLYMGTSNSTNLSDYTQIRAFNISTDNLKDQSFMEDMTTFEVVDSRIEENTLYYFALVDQDSNGNSSTVIPYELQTYDLTPPSFTGITDISPNPLQPSTAMDISFPATNSEGAPDYDTTGASSYVVEYTETPYVDGDTAWPADPCTSGTRHGVTYTANPGGVAGGTGVTITVSGLSPRTFYRFCVRAKDAYGNESGDLSTSTTIPVATLDSSDPIFDGIQGLSGVTPNGVYSIKVDWNKASDLHSNVKYYQLKIWSNTTDSSAAADLTTINRSASNSSYDTGTLIENGTDFNYGQGTRVYVLVNACDDADSIPDGSMNCTNYDDSLAMSIIPPDIEPPQNFSGISDATSNSSNGVATITWNEPTPWSSDYFGFRIYNSVYNSGTSSYDLTLLDSCNCASPGNCVSPTDLSCDVDNLDPNREYRFHVRAVDAAGNETQTNPVVSWEAVTIKDGNPPTFTPNLSGAWSSSDGAIVLNWTEATDNQYTGDITYQIFRRQPGQSDFTAGEIANPTESPRATVTNVGSYIDTDSNYTSVGGGDYYYLICAKDAQDNRTCANTSLNVFLPDVKPPDILTELESDKSTDTNNLLRLWDLKFKVTDNNTALDRLDIKVYTTFTTSAEVPAEISGNLDADGNSDSNRTDDTGTDYITISNLRGKAQDTGYVNYKVVVIDEYGNESSKTASYTYDARLTISSIASNKANKDLTKEVVVQGTGFSKGSENGTGTDTEVLLGGVACTNVTIYTSTVLTCDTPTGVSAGVVNVSISNPDSVTDSISGGFTFTDGSSFPHALCDTTTAQTASPFADGFGTAGDPYIVCNDTQFSAIGSYSSDHFELGAHIDASSFSGQIINILTGGIDGKGYMIYNNSSGYITRLQDSGYFKNVVYFNNTRTQFLSSVYGGTISNISFVNNTWVTGAVNYGTTKPFIDTLIYTTSPITIENISIEFNPTGDVRYIYLPLFEDVNENSFVEGDGLITIKNINISGSVSFPNTNTDANIYFFPDMPYAALEDINLNFDLTHKSTNGSYSFGIDIFRNLGAFSGTFNKSNSVGVTALKNINVNITVNKIEKLNLFQYVSLTEGTKADNLNFTITPDTDTYHSQYVFYGLRFNAGSSLKNMTIDIPKNTWPAAGGQVLTNYVEYDARTSHTDDIVIENIKYKNLDAIVNKKFFIGLLAATGGDTAASPTNMRTIKFSKIETMGPLVHIYNLSDSGSFSDLSTPAMIVENVKVNSLDFVSYGFSSYGGTSSAIVSGVSNYSSTQIYGLDDTSYWSAPTVSPYIQLNNVLVIPNATTEYLISEQADAADAVVNATHKALCDYTGSSNNFYLDTITNYTDNGSHTTCSAFSSDTESNLKDSSSGNVFESAGWDFTNTWQWPSGGGYPELR